MQKLPKINPSKSSNFLSIKVEFIFHNNICTFQIPVPKCVYEGASSSDKTLWIPSNKSENDATIEYYNSFIIDREQSGVIQSLINMLRLYKNKWNLSVDEYIELLVTYVQTIPYDTIKAKQGNASPRFLIETIVDNKGICSDKSLLLAGILAKEGFSVALFSFEKENHMTVGIAVKKGDDFQNTGYANIETTCLSYIGDSMDNYTSENGNNQYCTSMPVVIPIRNNGLSYTKIPDINYILNSEKNLKIRLEELEEKLKSLKNPENSLFSFVNTIEHNKYTYEYNKIVKEYNENLELYQYIRNNRPNRSLVISKINNR